MEIQKIMEEENYTLLWIRKKRMRCCCGPTPSSNFYSSVVNYSVKSAWACEICGSTAKNVVGAGETELVEHTNEASSSVAAPAQPTEMRSFWQGHRFLNSLLACMIFAFVISWLFHFNVPGQTLGEITGAPSI